MKSLEEAVHKRFATGKPGEQTSTQSLQDTSSASAAAVPAPAVEPPFARVNSVVPGSPAEQAGMQAGDKVTKFGWVNWINHERLGKVAQVVQQNENVSGDGAIDRSQLTVKSTSFWSRCSGRVKVQRPVAMNCD